MKTKPIINQPILTLFCLLIAAIPTICSATFSAGDPVILSNPVPPPPAQQGAVAFAVDDGTAETSIGDNGQFIWMNRFTPAAGEFPFQIEQIQVVIGTTGVTIGDAIQLLVYSDTDGDGDPGTGSVLLGEFTDVVQFNDAATFNNFMVPAPILVAGPGDVIIAVVNRAGAEGMADFPASIDTTASAGRSWVGSYLAGDVPAMPSFPADEQWGTIDSFGFPGNWMIRATGTIVGPLLPPPSQVPAMNMVGLMTLGILLIAIAGFAIKTKKFPR